MGNVHLGLLIACCLILNGTATAQLRMYPHPRSAEKVTSAKKSGATSRTAQLVPKSLPFWDDFSFTPVNNPDEPNSNYPVDSLWINNKSVWINNGMGINAPSINVATFDGLDSLFLPYSDQLLTNGFADSLVSQAIKLGEPEVSLAERNSVFLSFFYQWQGNGEAPDATDYLQLQFKNSTGGWETVMTIAPRASFKRNEFYDTLIRVDGERFFHNTFQFRFRNFGRTSGPYDTWNLDYIYLNKNRDASDLDFPDQAASGTLSGLFNNYQAIPYHHLSAAGALAPPTFDIYNALDEFTDVTYLTEGTFWNYKDNVLAESFYPNLGGTDTSAINSDGSGIIFPLERRSVTLAHIPDANDPNQFDPESDSVFMKLKVKLFTGDTFDPRTGDFAYDYDLNYVPIDFRSNDTISASYWMKDYYAYDDGIAEYAAGLTQAGNRAAVQFEMLIEEQDTLVGIDFYVPEYGLTSNLTADFYVYGDADGRPGNLLFVIPSFSVRARGLNTFQRIQILEPFLVGKVFYIGWKAPVGGQLKIGLDMSNNSGDKIFVNTNGTWVSNSNVNGSLMIRPVFGSGDIITSIPEEKEFGVFPNPSAGEFYIRGAFDKLQVLNTTGQPISFLQQDLGADQKIILTNASAGLYILKIQRGGTITTEKIIIR